MNLSNCPNWKLVEMAEYYDNQELNNNYLNNNPFDEELESRIPNEASYHFGGCAGQPIFVPIEPEYDDDGNPILEKMIGYDDKGNEVWIDAI